MQDTFGNDINIGDVVEIISSDYSGHNLVCGTQAQVIVNRGSELDNLNYHEIGVKSLDSDYHFGHNLNGKLGQGIGQYVTLSEIRLVESKPLTEAQKLKHPVGFYSLKCLSEDSRRYDSLGTIGYITYLKDIKYCFIYRNNKIVRLGEGRYLVNSAVPLNTIPDWINIKIKGCNESANLFPGNKKVREELIGKIFKIYNYLPEYHCKMDKKLRDVVVISIQGEDKTVENKKLKFLVSEIELLYPNPKGWNTPKERKLTVETSVKCINNKDFVKCGKIKVFKNEIFTIKKIEVNKMCPQRTILHLQDSHGNIHQGYKPNFKVI